MAVTKQTYTALASWTTAQAADLLKDAFIDAGYMTDWHDSFTISGSNIARVLKVEHDSTKTYGTSFYIFYFAGGSVRVSLASGWDTTSSVPTGTQFLDYFVLPSIYTTSDTLSLINTTPVFGGSQTSDLLLDRYTSGDDSRQSWFVFSQGTNQSMPFSVLHKNTTLHSWLDLDKGIITGYLRAETQVQASTPNRTGSVGFRTDTVLARCLLLGTAFRGAELGSRIGFCEKNYKAYAYSGLGAASNNVGNNFASTTFSVSCVILPVGKNSANPAFSTDYIPICTDLAWSMWTPTRLANDFAVYMHYASNTIAYQDKFIVQAGINEWETLAFSNSLAVNDAPSATFLARVV